ncbi:MAG: glycosyl hydrolase, partial [Bacteroidota bacterium]|nr:glycosyl hydrolase [Bacteroidota bacterium]
MKKLLLTTCVLSLVLSCQKSNDKIGISEQEFLKPSSENKVHTWWHWVQRSITKEGITKDLENMKAQGVVQATILNVGLLDDKKYGVPQVFFGSNEYYDLFQWALQEAKRLGITIGAHNCDGWSSSGGPWITPEKSMKMFTWSKVNISGGKNVSLTLPTPFMRDNFYKDVAVVAFPSISIENAFSSAKPEIKLNDSTNASVIADASPISALKVERGYYFTFKFKDNYTTNKITLLPRKEFMWNDPKSFTTKYILYSSTDGKKYKKISEFELKGLNDIKEIAFPKVTAKYFKLEVKDFGYTDAWLALTIAEVELLQNDEKPSYNPSIPYHQDKTIFIKAGDKSNFETISTNTIGIDESKIIDISDKMTSNGTLKWDAPAGNWSIIRFGYTTTSAKNAPATKEGEGLECDKMDTAAVNFHFAQYPQKLVDKAGDMAGSTFKFLLIDSWECAYQNWTLSMPSEFEKRRGYNLTKYIPALCGEVVKDGNTTEAFLYDFRKTIADLIENNYYKRFNELCHQNKLEMHAEVIYGGSGYPPLDVLSSNNYADMPMFEFWSGHGKESFPEYTAQKTVNFDFPASAALFYDKKVFGSEAYTAMAHYSEAPWDLKQFGDRAFCTGINQMILHSNVHQPTDSVPGMTLGPFGSHFNRNNSVFNFASSWIDYQSRIQYMLRQGQMQADILYYVGDQLPQYLEANKGNTIPQGYQIHACNYDILKNKIEVKNGKMTFGNVQFSLLTLPENMGMELTTLQRIEELVIQGVNVYGPKPTKPLSMKGLKDADNFKVLSDKLWGKMDGISVTENSYEKGKVYWGLPLKDVLSKVGLKPDFETNMNDTSTFLYTHRTLGDKDIYFVFNQQEIEYSRTLLFKTSNGVAKIFDPINGNIELVATTKSADGRTSLPIVFGPKESKIFVFEKGES